jgi:glycosyltransferase involved in cell wall biosynthesis
LRIFASSFSSKKIKRHDILAALSLVDGVELSFAGQWREGLDPGAVRLLGTISHSEMISHLSNSHYFAHPATNDCCPNSMVEALACGVPVLFGTGPGSGPELGSSYGIAISEDKLHQTVDLARQQYHAIRTRLVENRQEFSIRRAAESYANVFKQVVQTA